MIVVLMCRVIILLVYLQITIILFRSHGLQVKKVNLEVIMRKLLEVEPSLLMCQMYMVFKLNYFLKTTLYKPMIGKVIRYPMNIQTQPENGSVGIILIHIQIFTMKTLPMGLLKFPTINLAILYT